MSLALLMVLAVVDGAFASFRETAGRHAQLFKWQDGTYPRAVLRGGVCGLAVAALFSLVTGLVLRADPALWAPGLRAAEVMVWTLGAYASVVLGAFVPWLIFEDVDLRSLVTVIVFGPLTLLRPLVIGVAAAMGMWAAPEPQVTGLIALGCAGVLAVEPVLGWWRGREGG